MKYLVELINVNHYLQHCLVSSLLSPQLSTPLHMSSDSTIQRPLSHVKAQAVKYGDVINVNTLHIAGTLCEEATNGFHQKRDWKVDLLMFRIWRFFFDFPNVDSQISLTETMIYDTLQYDLLGSPYLGFRVSNQGEWWRQWRRAGVPGWSSQWRRRREHQTVSSVRVRPDTPEVLLNPPSEDEAY